MSPYLIVALIIEQLLFLSLILFCLIDNSEKIYKYFQKLNFIKVMTVTLLISLMVLGFTFIHKNGDFYGNLVPEFIGLTLEGLLFVVLLLYLQNKKDNEKEKEIKAILRGSLSHLLFVVGAYYQYHTGTNLREKGISNTDPNTIELYAELLAGKKPTTGLDDIRSAASESLKDVKNHMNLVPLLKPTEIDLWQVIVRNLESLSETDDTYSTFSSLIWLLDFLVLFDES